MELAIGMTMFFIVITMIFVAIAVFLPEWIGITGKKAHEVISEQQGLSESKEFLAPETRPTSTSSSSQERSSKNPS